MMVLTHGMRVSMCLLACGAHPCMPCAEGPAGIIVDAFGG